jgi:iron(III) transport system ATP-binding protein
VTILSAIGLSKSYGARKPAVDRASLSLKRGQITCLLGPSGCGKSTLLRLIAGLERPDAGEVRAGERVLSDAATFIPPEERDIGLVFQDYALFPHLTVEQNVGFGLNRLGAAERRARVLSQLEQVRMADRAGTYPQALSGGEQQRVALARALAREPRVVLLDEPFSGLDGRLKQEVRAAALKALRQSGAAVLVVTHDAEEAMMMADDLALMKHGNILQTGSPRDCYLNPASPAAARLLGDTVELPAMVKDGFATTAFGQVPAEGAGPARLIARPEAFRITDVGGVEAKVGAVHFAGPFVLADIEAGGHQAVARVPHALAPQAGATVHVRLEPVFSSVFAG